MRTVLGIDAAWTSRNPSGVALIQESTCGWSLVAVATSVPEFLELAPQDKGNTVAIRLVQASASLSGCEPEIVAIDMPMAKSSITGRRFSDNAVSQAYGARKCGTHSPNAERPGPVGERWHTEFQQAGYPLRTARFGGRGLVEVYPHPALVELARASERLTYKVGRVRAYWPESSVGVCREKLVATWHEIIDLLEVAVADTRTALEPLVTSGKLKAAEDALDAVVCAWVGSCILGGRAIPFGDEDSAIWVPNPR